MTPPPASVQRISDARNRGRLRAEEYLFGVRCAASGWPRTFCTTHDARRGFDNLVARLERRAA